jgi:hypothetical protein
MNGLMELKTVRGGKFEIFGGPYRQRPRNFRGVCMAAELAQSAHDVLVPTHDFSTPKVAQLIAGLDRTLDLIIAGEPVYVGCMGGIGRTGLFLAAIAKLWGEEDPVAYVRRQYIPHAVETSEQKTFIRNLEFPWALRMKAFRAKCKTLIGKRNRSLTNISVGEMSTTRRIYDLRHGLKITNLRAGLSGLPR